MGNMSDYIDSQFFIIDSNYLDDVKSKLYGFSMSNERMIYDSNLTDEFELNGEGTYVRILKKGNLIQISQDFTGCYGVYVYKNDSCFVISNSFLKLVEYVYDKYPISLNKDVLLSFLPADLCAIQYRQTMINEIEVLPRTYVINIDIEKKTFVVENKYYDEQSVLIDSEEGIRILDDWFYKWISIYRSIAEETNHLQVDLTGGLDSRLVFAILLNSNINLNKICIYSKIQGEVHKEDYEIASLIADKYNFKLNNHVPRNLIWFDDIFDSINQAYYNRLCYHKYFSFPQTVSLDPSYVSGGYGGERLRDYSFVTPQEYTEKCVKRAGSLSDEFKEPTRNVLDNTFKRLQFDFNINDNSSKLLPQLLFRETKNRNHFGKMSVDFYLTNQIRLSPLLDQNLFKLINEGDLLYALIFVRYCPELLNIKFDQGKRLDEEIINRARQINEKYSFKLKYFYYIDGAINEIPKNNLINPKKINPDDFIEEVFKSESFMNSFISYFSHDLYQKILHQVDNRNFQPLSLANCSIALLKIIHLVELNEEIHSKKPSIWLNNFLNIENFIK